MLLSVPNISEGRDLKLVADVGEAFASKAELLLTHSDADHDRSVFTLVAGDAGALEASLTAGFALATDQINVANYTGQHPSIGSVDVLPIVYHRPALREPAIELARWLAENLAERFGVPTFLYGQLASSDERRERAFFRSGGLAELKRRMGANELKADFGPPLPHPTAGATLICARLPLVAFNVELNSTDLQLARRIANEIRESNGGLVGVKAVGIDLDVYGWVQISTNVEDFVATPLARIVEEVARHALGCGVEVKSAEIVGLVPEIALDGFPPEIPIRGFDPALQVLERRVKSS